MMSKEKFVVGKDALHLHLPGICGVGMAGLALLLKARGHVVSGCDLAENEYTDWLRENDIAVLIGHDGSHVTAEVDMVIRSRAVPDDCADIVSAVGMGVPVFYRGEILPQLLEGHLSVAVSGTHGKTTVTSLIVQILLSAGKDPSWFVGAECAALSGIAHTESNHPISQSSNHPIVVEADESDGTVALYEPDIAVITNVDFDHMEHFKDEAEFQGCFKSLIDNTRKVLIYCGDVAGGALSVIPTPASSVALRAMADKDGTPPRRGHPARFAESSFKSPPWRGGFDEHLARQRRGGLSKAMEGQARERINIVSYGTGDNCNLRAIDIREDGTGQRFVLERGGVSEGEIILPVPGMHNVLNGLAACAVCFELGLSFDEVRDGLAGVSLPRRRFERVVDSDGVIVISDYAHHPAEIKALVETARKLEHKRLLAVFQPHRYTRTLALGADFPDAFEGVDELVLCPVYAASEKAIKGGTVYDLYERCSAFAKATADERNMSVKLADGLDHAWGYIRKELREGDVLLIIGAGDVHQLALWAEEEGISNIETTEGRTASSEAAGAKRQYRILRRPKGGQPVAKLLERSGNIEVKYNESLGTKTTLGVGGAADIWAEVESEAELVELMKWAKSEGLPFRVFGGGSNVLISDLGVRGVVARLSGDKFKNIKAGEPTPPSSFAPRATVDKSAPLQGGDNALSVSESNHPIFQSSNLHVTVGPGVSVAKLLGWMEENELTGLEFLEGIPGVMGGVLRMNAGAAGAEISERVSWIRYLNSVGEECIVEGKELKWEYRCCRTICDMIVLEVGLHLDEGNKESVRELRKERADQRAWMRGLRSAGSVFRNPSGIPGARTAGELIDEAGLKGRTIGGARVYEGHGNFIVTEKGASASDVKALIEIVKAEVLDQHGIELEEEIVSET